MRFKRTAALIASAMACYLVSILFNFFPEQLELFYSSTVNKWWIQSLSLLTGLVSFSVAEILVVAHFFLGIGILLLLMFKLWKGGWQKLLLSTFHYVLIVYIVFMCTWGFNYSRMSIGDMLALDVRLYSQHELEALAENLIDEANVLRTLVPENSKGTFYVPGGHVFVFENAQEGFDKLSDLVPALSGRYGKAKAIALSEPMLYTGIVGVYFPFTGEANVNVAINDLLLPATVLHEMAHQRGIAAEDEANFVAFLAARYHPDPIFQYSGHMLALIHTMNALNRVAPDRAFELSQNYSEGVRRDLTAQRLFWLPYQGRVESTATSVNDAYLRSNRQADGVASYGRMVDWLIAYKPNN